MSPVAPEQHRRPSPTGSLHLPPFPPPAKLRSRTNSSTAPYNREAVPSPGRTTLGKPILNPAPSCQLLPLCYSGELPGLGTDTPLTAAAEGSRGRGEPGRPSPPAGAPRDGRRRCRAAATPGTPARRWAPLRGGGGPAAPCARPGAPQQPPALPGSGGGGEVEKSREGSPGAPPSGPYHRGGGGGR